MAKLMAEIMKSAINMTSFGHLRSIDQVSCTVYTSNLNFELDSAILEA
jgi:hypothetical protein